MTNRELGAELGRLARQERRITNEILKLINLALERRAYLELGFSSMFDWLVRGYGYSNAAAYRRIEAAKLLKSVPSVAQKLEAGEVNLSTLSKAQSAIKAHEKAAGQKIPDRTKAEIVKKIEWKSTRDAERILGGLLPLSSVEKSGHFVKLSDEAAAVLKRAKEVLSHKFPAATDAEIVAYALNFFLDKSDPLRRPASAAEAKRVTKAGTKRNVVRSSFATCTYKDPVTGNVCGSRYQIQLDHIVPKALGGGDTPENLRPLCRQHNLFVAEEAFGKTHMNRFRRVSD